MFLNFSHRRKIFHFRVFPYDLEISETFKNDTRNATIRLQNIALIFLVFFELFGVGGGAKREELIVNLLFSGSSVEQTSSRFQSGLGPSIWKGIGRAGKTAETY